MTKRRMNIHAQKLPKVKAELSASLGSLLASLQVSIPII